jgi:tetratricopeptide (TPR) repeat protein
LRDSKVARKGAARAKKPEPPRKKIPVPRPPGQEKAIEEFASAMKLFQKRELAKAKDLFKGIIDAFPNESEIVDSARTYMQICERGLHPQLPRLKDADDYYNHGVVLMNQGGLEEASRMFERALAAEPGSEKILYTQAAAFALSGRREESLAVLRRAIAASHANRARAANDADFDFLREDPEFQSLVRGDRGAEA